MATQGDLGDYKLYTLPEPTEVAAHQTKQVAFLDLRAVPFAKVYVSRFEAYDTRGDEAPVPPETVLRLKNREDAGLGKPLPSGTVAVMETTGGALALAGEQKINDVAVGLPLELHLGRAMDVAVIPRVAAITRQDHVQRTTVEVSVENDKPQPIVLEHRQFAGAQDFKLVSASAPSTLDKGDRVWTFHLGPGQKATLTYVMTERD
jgi:hypothetical protein